MFRAVRKHRLRGALVAGVLLVLGMAPLGAQPLVDPTRPARSAPAPAASVETETTETPVLTSIIHGPERRLARLNGVWVREGERFDGGALIRVEPDAVRVRTESGRIVTLNLMSAHLWKRPTQQLADD